MCFAHLLLLFVVFLYISSWWFWSLLFLLNYRKLFSACVYGYSGDKRWRYSCTQNRHHTLEHQIITNCVVRPCLFFSSFAAQSRFDIIYTYTHTHITSYNPIHMKNPAYDSLSVVVFFFVLSSVVDLCCCCRHSQIHTLAHTHR